MSSYQYAGNNLVFFTDKNGDYIYDDGEQYKFSDGMLYWLDADRNWVEHVPEAGSFLETIFNALQEIYELSDISGGDSGGGFGQDFLNYFNNENIKASIYKFQKSRLRPEGNYHYRGNIKIDVELAKLIKAYTGNKKFEGMDLFLVLAHELAHALSFNIVAQEMRQTTWVNTPDGESLPIDEIFAVIVENQLRLQAGLPIRTHYMGSTDNPTLFEQSRIYDVNKNTGQFELTKPAQNYYNNYKKSLINNGIQWNY